MVDAARQVRPSVRSFEANQIFESALGSSVSALVLDEQVMKDTIISRDTCFTM
jgi:hypothetical protein